MGCAGPLVQRVTLVIIAGDEEGSRGAGGILAFVN